MTLMAVLNVLHSPATYVTGSYTAHVSVALSARKVPKLGLPFAATHPIRGLAQLHHRPPDISAARPTLLFIAGASDARTPTVRIDGELVGDRLDVRFCAWQEIVGQPAAVEERPGDGMLGFELLAEGFTGCAVEGGFQGIGFDVADPFRGDQTFAGGGLLAGG